jgi:hypothetical protein
MLPPSASIPIMIRPLLLAIFTTISSLSAAEPEWIQLFNGKDLNNWTPKVRGCPVGENYHDTFRVEDGLLKVSYAKYDSWGNRYGHLIFNRKFVNYRLRFEYRFTGSQIALGPLWAVRNSGFMIHCEAPVTMELNQDFPTGVQVQLLGGLDKGERSTLNVCTVGSHVMQDGKILSGHCNNSASKTYNGDVWVSAEIEVHGNGVIKHFVAGKEVLSYEKPYLDDKDLHAKELIEIAGKKEISEGFIAIQAISHPIEFRKIELLMLDK